MFYVKTFDTIGSPMLERPRNPHFEFAMLKSDWKKWDNNERALLVPGFSGLSWKDAFTLTNRGPFGGIFSFYVNDAQGNFATFISNPTGEAPPSTQTAILSFSGEVARFRSGTSADHYVGFEIMGKAKLGTNRFTTINGVYRPTNDGELDSYKLVSLDVSQEDGDPYLNSDAVRASSWTAISLGEDGSQLFPEGFPPIQFPQSISKGVSMM